MMWTWLSTMSPARSLAPNGSPISNDDVDLRPYMRAHTDTAHVAPSMTAGAWGQVVLSPQPPYKGSDLHGGGGTAQVGPGGWARSWGAPAFASAPPFRLDLRTPPTKRSLSSLPALKSPRGDPSPPITASTRAWPLGVLGWGFNALLIFPRKKSAAAVGPGSLFCASMTFRY